MAPKVAVIFEAIDETVEKGGASDDVAMIRRALDPARAAALPRHGSRSYHSSGRLLCDSARAVMPAIRDGTAPGSGTTEKT